MGAKLKEIIRINKAKCLPIKVFFQICTFVKRALKDQYCGNGMLYFPYIPPAAARRVPKSRVLAPGLRAKKVPLPPGFHQVHLPISVS